MITKVQLRQIIGFKSDQECFAWHLPMPRVFEKYEMTTTVRMAAFLAQCAHESAGFTALSENLNYSADGLRKVFKKYFPTVESTTGYARSPQKIANKVYANRMGNGDEASGDGWTYRGRGLIQLTGKNNYTKFGSYIEKPLDQVPAYLESKEGALESAAWFFQINNLNAYADKGDIKGMTKRINGGYHGLEDRQARYEKALKVLKT